MSQGASSAMHDVQLSQIRMLAEHIRRIRITERIDLDM
jgi:hypothetical protein